MRIIYLKTKSEGKRFLNFRRRLYHNDRSYVSTAEFVLKDVLFKKTDFTKACYTQPIIVNDGGRDVAEAILIHHAALPYLQIGFFEAEEHREEAVSALLAEAKKVAVALGAEKIVIGLNAHISYGVGILTENFGYKNTFDSLYNKPYYQEYFKSFRRETLSTYRGNKDCLEAKMPSLKSHVRVRHADMSRFREETELMWQLCEKTISRTFLYYPVGKTHFYDLMKDMKPFLSGKNLLFAENEKGEATGFLFWHPDYNGVLRAGRTHSIPGIALSYWLKRKSIDTVKINAIGTLSPQATYALIAEFRRLIGDTYRSVETNFVWDNNIPSVCINRHFSGEPHRKYEVYLIDEIDPV